MQNKGRLFTTTQPYKCPVCDGTGLVTRPPGLPGDQLTWESSGTAPHSCRACLGTGILWGVRGAPIEREETP